MTESTSVPICHVYVSCQEDREIHVFRMDGVSGALVRVQVEPVPGTEVPSPGNLPLAISPDRRTLYAALRTPPFPVSAYEVYAHSGCLTLRSTTPLPAPMAYLHATADGAWLWGASYTDGMVSVNKIVDGRIQAPPRQLLRTPPKAHCIVEGRHGLVFVSSVEANQILQYRRGRDGTLEAARVPAVTAGSGAGPRHLVLHPRLDVLYSINEHAGSVTAYAVDADQENFKAMQEERLVPDDFTGNALAADIHLTPDGRWLYASVRNTHTLHAFEIEAASGRLVSRDSFDVEAFPRGFAIAPSGRHLVCAGQQSNTIGVYSIDLHRGTLQRREVHSVGRRPNWVEIVPG